VAQELSGKSSQHGARHNSRQRHTRQGYCAHGLRHGSAKRQPTAASSAA
jgi:hypothetical protein